MNEEEAARILEPFYNLFRSDRRDWDKGMDALTDDWKAYYTNTDFRTKEDTRPYIAGLFDIVPDINVNILQLFVGPDFVGVRSELSGTPKTDFMVPHSGHKFSIMTIDIHQIRGEKICALYHLEDWGTAIRQLSAQPDQSADAEQTA